MRVRDLLSKAFGKKKKEEKPKRKLSPQTLAHIAEIRSLQKQLTEKKAEVERLSEVYSVTRKHYKDIFGKELPSIEKCGNGIASPRMD